jgi:hypothetical protein
MSNRLIEAAAVYISKDPSIKQIKEEKLGLYGETHKELEERGKEMYHTLKNNMKSNNVPHHSGEHHASEDYGDVIDHAGHYNGHHVSTQLNYEFHFGHGRVPKLNEKAVRREVKRQNPHVSPEIHEKHANDIINFEKKMNEKRTD